MDADASRAIGTTGLPPNDNPDNPRYPTTGQQTRPVQTHFSQEDQLHRSFVARVERIEAELAPAVRRYLERVVAAATGEPGAGPLICGFWMYGVRDGKATWIEGGQQRAVPEAPGTEGFAVEAAEEIRRQASGIGAAGACILHVRLHQDAAGGWDDELELRDLRRYLLKFQDAVRRPSLDDLDHAALLFESSGMALVADPEFLRAARLAHHSEASQVAVPLTISQVLRLRPLLASWYSEAKADIFLALTTVSLECQRRWMRDARQNALSDATTDLADLNQSDGVPTDPRHVLNDLMELWGESRAAVKQGLESFFERLSAMTFPTYEDKRAIADLVVSAMTKWGFVAVAPDTGLPSYLRVRKNNTNPKGLFYFEAVAGATPVRPPEPGATATSVGWPIKHLSEMPTRVSSDP